jgi:hypothetical protein
MKTKGNKKQMTLEKDYGAIMKGFQNQYLNVGAIPQWTKPSDFIVKFSLYQEYPNSIASADTSVNLG